MANEEHLVVLKQGVEIWNEWRKKNPEIIPDLSGAILKDADLRNVDLRYADLSQTNLIEANMSGQNISRQSFKQANLSQADLSRVEALETDFRGANLTGACIEDWHINNETKLDIATEAIKSIEANPTLMERILSALKAGGISALEQALNHPAASFVIDALKDWQQSKV
jgi:trans-aconitate methyltransferase